MMSALVKQLCGRKHALSKTNFYYLDGLFNWFELGRGDKTKNFNNRSFGGLTYKNDLQPTKGKLNKPNISSENDIQRGI